MADRLNHNSRFKTHRSPARRMAGLRRLSIRNPALRSTLHRAKQSPKSTAFTLVEMLAVLILFALALALIIGVSSNVVGESRIAQTRDVQRTLLAALRSYHDAFDTYPPGDGEPDSSAAMLKPLTAASPCRDALAMLPANATTTTRRGARVVLDGFDRPLRYFRTGGLGGQSPMILSLGFDPDDPTDDIVTE